MMRLKKRGFTLVEIMIVVAILGLLAAIAIPNFITARQRTLEKVGDINCALITRAKYSYAAYANVAPSANCAWTDIIPYLQTDPRSATDGGNYNIGTTVGDTVTFTSD